jgi:hypothetical protein
VKLPAASLGVAKGYLKKKNAKGNCPIIVLKI